jgi:hypothetical protein
MRGHRAPTAAFISLLALAVISDRDWRGASAQPGPGGGAAAGAPSIWTTHHGSPLQQPPDVDGAGRPLRDVLPVQVEVLAGSAAGSGMRTAYLPVYAGDDPATAAATFCGRLASDAAFPPQMRTVEGQAKCRGVLVPALQARVEGIASGAGGTVSAEQRVWRFLCKDPTRTHTPGPPHPHAYLVPTLRKFASACAHPDWHARTRTHAHTQARHR